MALSSTIILESYNSLLRTYAAQLNDTDKVLLNLINEAAAEDDIALHFQDKKITDFIIKHIKESKSESSKDLEGSASIIYIMALELMESQSAFNRRRHTAQGKFDTTSLPHRSLLDQMQDHDMTLMMPKSVGNISVFAPLNRSDEGSIEAIQEVFASEVYNEAIKHIIIPVGPGHWRGVYLTKPSVEEDEFVYTLELFDPYGPNGAVNIERDVTKLLEFCQIPKEFVKINYTGPKHPQGDAYSCGDFTCAHSHKKMKELGAPKGSYNETLINTLDNLGNANDVLRFMTREEILRMEQGATVRAQDKSIESEPPTNSVLPEKLTPETSSVPNTSTQSTSSVIPINGTSSISTETNKSTTTITTEKPESSNQVIELKLNGARKTPATVTPPKPVQESNLSPAARIDIETASTVGVSGVGALIGGLIGFFLLPGLGALAGALIGAGIGALLSITTVAFTRLWGSNNSTTAQEKQLKSDTTASSTSNSMNYEETNKHDKSQDKEPVFSPTLFAKTPPQTPREPADHLSPKGP